jgi:hypothetical protein
MKNLSGIRARNLFKNFAFIVALGLFVVSPLAQRWGWCKDPDRGISIWPDDNGKNDRLSYLELVKLLNEYLKDAQQVNIYTDLCHGGALLTQAKELKMPYFVAVGEKDAANCTVGGTGSLTDQKPPGRLKVKVDKDTTLYFYSFADYVTATLKDADAKQIPTAKSLFESAYKDVKEDPQTKGETPDSTSGNDAKTDLAINGGAESNHALIFDGDFKDFNAASALELYRVLANKKYGFKQKDGNNSLQFYYYFWEPKKDYEGTNIDGMGTLANFKVALQNLQKRVQKNPKKELVNIFFTGHGYQTAAAAPRQPGLDGMPKDGFLVMGRTTALDVPTDASFWHDLKVGLLPNDENLVRVHPAALVLYVSEASMSQPVAIAINDLPLGYFYLSSTSTGGELEVSLPDSFTKALIAEADGAPSINVTLALTPGDYLRIATEDDILLDPAYSQGDYGFGIATTVIGMGPQPAAGVPPKCLLLGCGL